MYSRLIVTPSTTLLKPGIEVWPPDRTATWHGSKRPAAVRTFTAVDTSSALFGCKIQLGVNLLLPLKYEAKLASYALCPGKVTRLDTELRRKSQDCAMERVSNATRAVERLTQ
jgi:hypothetical protein